MAIAGDKGKEKIHIGQEGKQKSISQRSDQEEFETGFPSLNSGGFKSHLGIGKAQGHLDLPTSGIGKDGLPGLFSSVDRLGREEIPGLASVTGARNNQEELAFIIGQMKGSSDNACLALTTSAGIPHHAVFPGTFATHDFPGFVFASIGSDEMVLAVPAQDKTQVLIQRQCRPGSTRKPAIPDMHDLSPPQFCHFSQDFAFFQPFLAGFFTPGGPPTQVS